MIQKLGFGFPKVLPKLLNLRWRIVANLGLPRSYCREVSPEDDGFDVNNLDDSLAESGLLPKSLLQSGMPHQMFVIQPYIKWGPNKNYSSTPELRLDEACSLVGTLPGWKVVSRKIVPLLSFDKKSFFNKGQLADLQSAVTKNKLITSVFLNVNTLQHRQHAILEEIFNVPVFDRYTIVINIFKLHAVTKEAKLQVAMAEIPYLWSRLRDDGFNSKELGDISLDKRTHALIVRQQKIKKSISNLRKNRELLRNRRKIMEFPVVAVVGYTNAGKTSLIKCLTQEESLKPENKLFATLDVTLHEGYLPSNLKVLYVDTIGFISDIPTKLLEPFVVTLEDALQADVIVHVRDISHPDEKAQNEHVQSTLKSLSLSPSVIENIVEVGNKCDKITEDKYSEDLTLVSCLNSKGIEELKYQIEKAVLKARDITRIKIRVRNGGEEFSWLYKNSAVSEVEVDTKDNQFIFLNVLISKSKLGQFKHIFISGR